jgi:hypothetical protein
MFLLIASGHMLYMCARFRVRNLFRPLLSAGSLFVQAVLTCRLSHWGKAVGRVRL